MVAILSLYYNNNDYVWCLTLIWSELFSIITLAGYDITIILYYYNIIIVHGTVFIMIIIVNYIPYWLP